MAATEYDLGNDDEAPGLPAVAVRFAGELGAPLVVVEAAILTPEAAIEYAQRIFAAAAEACRQSRFDVAGYC